VPNLNFTNESGFFFIDDKTVSSKVWFDWGDNKFKSDYKEFPFTTFFDKSSTEVKVSFILNAETKIKEDLEKFCSQHIKVVREPEKKFNRFQLLRIPKSV